MTFFGLHPNDAIFPGKGHICQVIDFGGIFSAQLLCVVL
jgi:hypothetical protein